MGTWATIRKVIDVLLEEWAKHVEKKRMEKARSSVSDLERDTVAWWNRRYGLRPSSRKKANTADP